MVSCVESFPNAMVVKWRVSLVNDGGTRCFESDELLLDGRLW